MSQKMTVKDIAAREKISPVTIRKWAKSAGFETPRGRGHVAEFDDAQVKKILAQKGA